MHACLTLSFYERNNLVPIFALLNPSTSKEVAGILALRNLPLQNIWRFVWDDLSKGHVLVQEPKWYELIAPLASASRLRVIFVSNYPLHYQASARPLLTLYRELYWWKARKEGRDCREKREFGRRIEDENPQRLKTLILLEGLVLTGIDASFCRLPRGLFLFFVLQTHNISFCAVSLLRTMKAS
ncbi:uncharacterized protein C8R40DRAFT_1066616 [Lentinula edodes]|uniref:uncharacterized protein n=1 Tax=Lentinula edodes TaxID=5353 RepID=UPI001E8DB842|nr:uncharacterized protein C8R40DRAFT_1066616 [Lentinula edodes]KAH7878847.1 hypothetical protein C8R40DRAFT_1066616 [Lentinula edodes]